MISTLRKHFVSRYLSIDPRSLAALRIAMALVLLLDLARRAAVLPDFYTNDGLLPNHMMLWRPTRPHMFSFLFMASTETEAMIGFSLIGVVFVGLLVGYRTRLMQVLSLLSVVSLNSRVSMLENGGDMALNALCIWTLVLPLGQRFSVDALLRSLRARNEARPEQLLERESFCPDARPVVSLAVLAIYLQLSIIYLFNTLHKSGATWIDGTAVHYTLHQDRIITGFGIWLRERMTLPLSQALTWSTLAIEGSAAVLILIPVGTLWTRRIAIVTLTGMHIGFALCVDVGIFSFSMMAYYPALLSAKDWDFLARVTRRRLRERVAYFDASCGMCFQLVRILARLDRLRLLSFVANDDPRGLPESADGDLVTRTIVVQDQTGGISTRARAVSDLCMSLPVGFVLAWSLRLPGVLQLANWLYDRVAQNRAGLSAWLGLGVCGAPGLASIAPEVSGSTAARRDWERWRRIAGEALCVLWLVVCVGEVQQSNRVPSWMKYHQPALFQAWVDYARGYQPWAMFAPEAPTKDMAIYVDAVTVDGRQLDPYNELASRVPVRAGQIVPDRLGQAQFWCGYSLFIPRPGYRNYLGGLEGWLRNYHKRTGNPKDRIVRYKAYELWDESPPPGEYRARKPTSKLFHSAKF